MKSSLVLLAAKDFLEITLLNNKKSAILRNSDHFADDYAVVSRILMKAIKQNNMNIIQWFIDNLINPQQKMIAERLLTDTMPNESYNLMQFMAEGVAKGVLPNMEDNFVEHFIPLYINTPFLEINAKNSVVIQFLLGYAQAKPPNESQNKSPTELLLLHRSAKESPLRRFAKKLAEETLNNAEQASSLWTLYNAVRSGTETLGVSDPQMRGRIQAAAVVMYDTHNEVTGDFDSDSDFDFGNDSDEKFFDNDTNMSDDIHNEVIGDFDSDFDFGNDNDEKFSDSDTNMSDSTVAALSDQFSNKENKHSSVGASTQLSNRPLTTEVSANNITTESKYTRKRPFAEISASNSAPAELPSSSAPGTRYKRKYQLR